MSFCPNCGTEAKQGSRFCTVCSHPLDQPASDTTPQKPDVGETPAITPTLPAPGQPAPSTDGGAIASLVLALVGLVLCPVVPSVIAIFVGRVAEKRIRESGGSLGGEGLAKAGWIIGIIGILWGIILVILLLLSLGLFFVTPEVFTEYQQISYVFS